ncbi:hypothetical protein JV173_03320 [Acholeplasma equirhinis]|uniref:hypothetical protein n=1 Tax=Acholeplasma equirhinis TaxID=555393 RepID=UPI00197ACB6E|nr:hypothetical protein [Acholeplasma equirhinis]MBN3490539.1 hypothetical protein [Acholeplasma equirhinis]
MFKDYKKEYKENYDFIMMQFRDFNKHKNYDALRSHIERIKERDSSPGHTSLRNERFDLKLVHNASKNALRDFTRECHQKGLTIYGRRLRK